MNIIGLFRGWDEEHKCWRYGYYTKLVEGIRKFDAIICDEDGDLVRYYIHDSKTIGRNTGLHDKNNKPIFEGDCCKTDQGIIGYIEFFNGSFTWTDGACHWTMVDFNKILEESTEKAFDLEIIGSIHTTPELHKDQRREI